MRWLMVFNIILVLFSPTEKKFCGKHFWYFFLKKSQSSWFLRSWLPMLSRNFKKQLDQLYVKPKVADGLLVYGFFQKLNREPHFLYSKSLEEILMCQNNHLVHIRIKKRACKQIPPSFR